MKILLLENGKNKKTGYKSSNNLIMEKKMALDILIFETKSMERKILEKKNIEGYNFIFYEQALNDEFIDTISDKILEDTIILSIEKNSFITKNILDKFKNLRVISVRTTNYDNISLNECCEKNIAVVNTVHDDGQSAAQYTIGLIISLVRKIKTAASVTRFTEDFNEDYIGTDLSKMTLGLVGTDFVGMKVCEYAKAFGLNIIASDSKPKQQLKDKYGVNYMPLDELAKNSDIISVHLNYTPENFHVFDEEFFLHCKDNFYFVSIAQAELIEFDALDKYLSNGKIKGLALDIVPCEDSCKSCKQLSEHIMTRLECFEHTNYIEKFRQYPNVIITPRIASMTNEYIDTTLNQNIINIKEALNGEKMCRIV